MPQTAPPLTQTTSDLRQSAAVACALAIVTLVLLPCVVTFLPTIYFDVDPRTELGRSPVVAFGPMGAAWYQTAAVLIAAISLAISVWAGAVVRWGAVVLVGVGMLACAYHLPRHFDNELPTAGWIAAMALGLAALHLGQLEAARRWMIAGLVAMILPMALQAAWYLFAEHPATVASYLETEAEMLRSRGWEAGSPQHEIYRRRLMNWQVTGTFGLSNVFGSIAAAFTLVAAAVVAGTWSRPSVRQWAWMLLPVVLLGTVTTMLSRSSGAAVGLIAGVAVLFVAGVVPNVIRRQAARLKSYCRGGAFVATAAVVLVVLAFGAVLLRGAVGAPDTFDGERTVLFRFHYWQAAWRLIAHDLPGSALLGVGPSGFHEGYLWAKNPLNPEDVTSAHNVFVDYVTMLGVGGWALTLVLLLWLAQAGLAVGRGDRERALPQSPDQPALPRHHLVLAGAVAAVVFGLQYRLLLPQLMIETALLWLASGLAFVGVMALVAVPGRRSGWWGSAGLFAAATAVLVHNQIEMAFYQFTSAGIVWVMVALAAARYSQPRRVEGNDAAEAADSAVVRMRAYVPAFVLAVAATLLGAGYAIPATAHQQRLAGAARALQTDRYMQAVALLDEAGERRPSDSTVTQWRVSLRSGMIEHAARIGRRDVAAQQLAEALAIVDRVEAAGGASAALYRYRARLHLLVADALGRAEHRAEAAVAWRRALEYAPYNMSTTIELADLLWQLDERGEAADLYRRALRLHQQNYLDPARQLPDDEQQRIVGRMAAIADE